MFDTILLIKNINKKKNKTQHKYKESLYIKKC